MKLAEALLERKNLLTKISELQLRASQNTLVQEGDTPAENVTELLTEQAQTTATWQKLVSQINSTNNVARLESGVSIAEAIVARDALDQRIRTLQIVINAAQVQQNRFSRAEIKFVTTVDVTATRRDLDAIAKERRELDATIQALNWTTDLIESQ